MFETHESQVLTLGKPAGSALTILRSLRRQPFLTSITRTADDLHLTRPTVTAAVNRLVSLGITRPTTSRRRNRMFAYEAYLKILGEGTEEPIRT